MDITAKTFEYQTGVVTRKQFDDHMTLYKGYVTKTNEITHTLATNPEWASANATYSHYRGLKRGQTYALDGVILHELYFENLGEKTTPIGRKTQHILDAYKCLCRQIIRYGKDYHIHPPAWNRCTR